MGVFCLFRFDFACVVVCGDCEVLPVGFAALRLLAVLLGFWVEWFVVVSIWFACCRFVVVVV